MQKCLYKKKQSRSLYDDLTNSELLSKEFFGGVKYKYISQLLCYGHLMGFLYKRFLNEVLLLINFFLNVPRGLQYLSSLTRD